MLGKGGKVIGIEVIPELVENGKRNISKSDSDLFQSGKVTIKRKTYFYKIVFFDLFSF